MFLPVLGVLVGSLVSVQCDYPFRNTSLPWSARVDDLVSRLTLDEIQYQMHSRNVTRGIDRLGIPPYNWYTECLRGDSTAPVATAFPQAIGLGAAFSTDLIGRVAEATSVEVRAYYNSNTTRYSLGCFAPVINLVRDSRWGRNQETYGEDPHLTGAYAVSFVKGLQGDHPRYIRANAGCKHFVAYDGPENWPVSRLSFDAKVSERDLRTTFFPAFRQCVQAGSYNIMCSYNRVNGYPACADHYTLSTVLRDQWNFSGYVVSDGGAIGFIIDKQHYVNNTVDCAAAAINAGVNLERERGRRQAVNEGKLKEDLVRERVKKLFYTRMRLGNFDPPEMNPYSSIDMSHIQSEEHRNLAVEAAMKSFVLLKNTGDFLPIKENQFKRIAIVGPFANNTVDVMGNYAPNPDPKYMSTVFDAMASLAPSVKFASGCVDVHCNNYTTRDVPTAVKDAQLVVVCLGTGQTVESEGLDRPTLYLPGDQQLVLADALTYTGEETKIVLLLFNAGPLNISWVDNIPRVVSVVECFLPAQATGTAVRNTLTNHGPYSVPAARLPYTWPMYADQIPSMTNYSMKGRTYRYFNGDPMYPFGYGLSYASFIYSELNYDRTVKAGDDLLGSVTVTNTKGPDAEEVVQIYIQWDSTDTPTPHIQLVDFHRVEVKAGQQVKVNFKVKAGDMAVWVDEKGWVVEKGSFSLYAGGQQPNQKRKIPSNVLWGSFQTMNSVFLGVY